MDEGCKPVIELATKYHREIDGAFLHCIAKHLTTNRAADVPGTRNADTETESSHGIDLADALEASQILRAVRVYTVGVRCKELESMLGVCLRRNG